MKKEYKTPQIEIHAIEESYLQTESQITIPIGDGEVEPGTPNLSCGFTFQDDDWDSMNNSTLW